MKLTFLMGKSSIRHWGGGGGGGAVLMGEIRYAVQLMYHVMSHYKYKLAYLNVSLVSKGFPE